MINIKDIESVKFIAIVVDKNEMLPDASALYTHLLRLHKKVSIISTDKKENKKFSFLPWYEKIRDIIPSTADLIIELDDKKDEVNYFFENNKIALNQKIATALYASLLIRYDGFISDGVDGIIFARASQLIDAGAEYKLCNKFIMKRTTLATMKLKALMLKNISLKHSAKEAVFYISDDDLKLTGATLEDAQIIMKEVLYLEYVENVTLVKSDEENRIVKLISKEI
ncbi:MAG: phosphoesterase [Epsilonproteobacteria bacterium]|nr:MAG: phosphoesterase [Campylobacterota bacterium]